MKATGVRIGMGLALLSIMAGHPPQALADSFSCTAYHKMWLAVDAIFQGYVVDDYPVDSNTTYKFVLADDFPVARNSTAYQLEVTRVWKGRAPREVTAYTGEEWPPEWGRRDRWDYGGPPSYGVEHTFYYVEGYHVWLGGVCDPTSVAAHWVGSELAALRIMYYGQWIAAFVLAAALALILRAA